MFDQIEKLKRKYTDQYVVVDGERPELARFAGYTGQVKTVNMSGRALVEFDAWNNIGWYDIDVSFLTLVTKPEAGAAAGAAAGHAKPAAAKPAAAKPAEGAKKVSAAELARAQGAAKPAGAAPAAGKKPSTADILAAARAAKASGEAPAAAASKPSAKPAAAPAASESGKKLSTAEILAAARAKKAGGEAEAVEPAPASPAAVAAEPHVTHEVGPEAPLAESARRAAASGPKPTTTAEKIAWCRQHDAHS